MESNQHPPTTFKACEAKQHVSLTDHAPSDEDGAINERKRRSTVDVPIKTSTAPNDKQVSNFDPLRVRSHLLHAIEGLDRYPNYLSRWNNDDDILRLENALLHYARLARTQLEDNQRVRHTFAETIIQDTTTYQNGVDGNDHMLRYSQLQQPPNTWDEVKEYILHPEAYKFIFKSRLWDFTKVTVDDVLLRRVDVAVDVGSFNSFLEEEMLDVFSFPLFRPEFCAQILSYLKNFQQRMGQNPDNSLQSPQIVGQRYTDLDVVGLGWINNLLFHLILQPISRHLFQSTETKDLLDWRQGYVAAYRADPHHLTNAMTNLVTHTDDAEVTLNICLSDENDFEGGMLEFLGLRGSHEQGKLLGSYQPILGRAVIHSGRHLHRVTTVSSGQRYVYVMWTRSWKGTRSQSCPCCWLNRRMDQSCICGPTWN
jgi:hypothetical protein